MAHTEAVNIKKAVTKPGYLKLVESVQYLEDTVRMVERFYYDATGDSPPTEEDRPEPVWNLAMVLDTHPEKIIMFCDDIRSKLDSLRNELL